MNAPDKEQVRLIFKELYLLYVKYVNEAVIDWEEYHGEIIDLSNKYPYELTKKMIIEITEIFDILGKIS